MRTIFPTTALCSILLLASACGSSSNDEASPASLGTAPEAGDGQLSDSAGAGAALGEPLSATEEAALVAAVLERTASDGASYEFDIMEPIFEDRGDTIALMFRYLEDNIRGGTPIAVISRESSEIVSIRYTR